MCVMEDKMTLDRSGRPYTISVGRNLLLDEGRIHVWDSSGLNKFNPVPVSCVGGTIKCLGGPQKWCYNGPLNGWGRLVCQNTLTFCSRTSRRVEANCAGVDVGRADPAPMHSWLSCRCLEFRTPQQFLYNTGQYVGCQTTSFHDFRICSRFRVYGLFMV